MITDCSTFLIEYLISESPLINIVSSDAPKFNKMTNEILKTYYKANDLEELEKTLDNLLNQNNDYLFEKRKELKAKLLLNATQNILNDLLSY
jgi:hypothetical protein